VSKPATILIADDIAGQRMVLDMLLSIDGYEVHMVEDGLAALDFLKYHTPDLVILDVVMPNLGGLEVCGRMKRVSRLKDVPVIILTAHRDDHVVAEAKYVKADALIYKPLEGKDLRLKVRELLANRSLAVETAAHDVAGELD